MARISGVACTLALGTAALSQIREVIDPNTVWFGTAFVAINIIATALQSSIETAFRLNQDRVNARRYHETAERLAQLYTRHLARVRRHAANDELRPARHWFTCCNSLILGEHRQWRRETASETAKLMAVEKLAAGAKP